MSVSSVVETVERLAVEILSDYNSWSEDKPRLNGPYARVGDAGYSHVWVGWWLWVIADRIVAEPFVIDGLYPIKAAHSYDIGRRMRFALEKLERRVREAMESIGGIRDGELLPMPEAIADPEVSPTEGA